MGFQITITEEADAQMQALLPRERRILETAIQARLLDEPMVSTKA